VKIFGEQVTFRRLYSFNLIDMSTVGIIVQDLFVINKILIFTPTSIHT